MSNELNDRLRAALRPVDPGARFTQGVLARIASEPPRVPASAGRAVRMLGLRWLSGALLAVVATVGVFRRLPIAYGLYVLPGLILPLTAPRPDQPLPRARSPRPARSADPTRCPCPAGPAGLV